MSSDFFTVAPLLLRKGLHLPGREALSERKTLFLSGLTLVVACLRSASSSQLTLQVSAPEVASLPDPRPLCLWYPVSNSSPTVPRVDHQIAII